MDTRVGLLTLALAALGPLVATAHAQTPGMERRDQRRGARQDARGTRQGGREAGRDAQAACRDQGGNPVECRQQKRGVRQGARQGARDTRQNARQQRLP